MWVRTAVRFVIAAYLALSVTGTFTAAVAAPFYAVASSDYLRGSSGFFTPAERGGVDCLALESKEAGRVTAHTPGAARFGGAARLAALLETPGAYAARVRSSLPAGERARFFHPPHEILLKLRI